MNQKILSKEFKLFSIFLNFFFEREINIGLRLHLSTQHFYLSIFLPFLTIYIGATRRWVIEDRSKIDFADVKWGSSKEVEFDKGLYL